MKLERKSDKIKVIESSGSAAVQALTKQTRCIHCQERYYLTENKGDIYNLFCSNCGGLTPLRTIKHGRGIAAPAMQQPTALVQSNQGERQTRRPKSINSKKNPLEESLIQQGRQIISSDYREP